MKKFIKFIFVNLLTLNSTIVLVGCRPGALAEVWVISDGGDLFDNGFNQQIIDGSKNFVSTFNQKRQIISKIPGFEEWENHPMNYNWIISQDAQLSTLQNNYKIAYWWGAKTIICAGFNHIPALTKEIQNEYKAKGVRFIVVDSTTQNPINVAGLTFASEESSFFAGLAGAIWLVANHEQYDDKTALKISAFGGIPADVIIEMMAGYYWGVDYFNEKRASDSNIIEMINKIRDGQGKTRMEKEDLEKDKYKIIFEKSDNSFTGSFQSGTSNAKAVIANLLARGNNIIFGVAGNQVIDLIAAINSSDFKKKLIKFIGADIDQTKPHKEAKDSCLTSALKKIEFAVFWMLWKAFDLKNENDEISYDPTAEKYFNGSLDYLPLTGKDYTGIADNLAIKDIYSLLMTETYWELAKKVFKAFNKLANDVNERTDVKKWENAWKNDVGSEAYRPEF